MSCSLQTDVAVCAAGNGSPLANLFIGIVFPGATTDYDECLACQ